MTWTRPYYGVQHLKPLPRGWQITVEDWGDWASCWVKPPGSFKDIREQAFLSSANARAWGEEQAKLLGAP